jgi:peptidoglycan/LPS O-acetylase OafA/YrhL
MKAIKSFLKALLRNITIAIFLIAILAHVSPFIALFTEHSKISLFTSKVIVSLNGIVGIALIGYLFFLLRNNVKKYWPTVVHMIVFLALSTTVYRFFFINNYSLNFTDLGNILFYLVIILFIVFDYKVNFKKSLEPAEEAKVNS